MSSRSKSLQTKIKKRSFVSRSLIEKGNYSKTRNADRWSREKRTKKCNRP